MNNSLEILYDEHVVITRAATLARDAASLIGKRNEQYETTMRELIRFFRMYADQYHHHKEEIILFPEMAKKNELVASGIIQEMFDNHTHFRDLLRTIETNLNHKEYSTAAKNVVEYTEALLDHIAVENDEVFQTAYALFDEEELENIFFRFSDLDRELGDSLKMELVAITEKASMHE